MEEMKSRKTRVSNKWIKADSGRTYLCPADKLAKLDNPSEKDLKTICVDESDNPQNS